MMHKDVEVKVQAVSGSNGQDAEAKPMYVTPELISMPLDTVVRGVGSGSYDTPIIKKAP